MRCMKWWLAALGFILVSCVEEKAEPEWSLQPGDYVPQFSITMNDGSEISTADLAGEISVITFFNTSCGDCRNELPQIQLAYAKALENELPARFICIAREENAENIQYFWQSNGLTLPYSPQSDRKVYSMFASVGIPRIYIADEQLRITYVFDEYSAPTAESLLHAITSK